LNFALFYASDAYSTAAKIMGRQSAGKALLNGVARTWRRGVVRGVGNNASAAREMLLQLRADGFQGELQWSELPEFKSATEVGNLFYPAPPARDIAAARNLTNPAAFSLIGVTHTLSSTGAADQVSDCILPPFQPWDALICTSLAARNFVAKLHEEIREYWRLGVGATRFIDLQLPVIPLGVDAPAFALPTGLVADSSGNHPLNCGHDHDKSHPSKPLAVGGDTAVQIRSHIRSAARTALGISPQATVFLFAGRLSFHAKANPAALYQALQSVAVKAGPIICIEAGIFPNSAIQEGFKAAQGMLAPDVSFLWVDGNDASWYRSAWLAADVFITLSDNIQETFGLTPVEAMAAGLPVIVSDWDGYKDTVRDGLDGYRVPTVIPPGGSGSDLALRHALGLDSYDYFVGCTSLATVVEPNALASACLRLATDPNLRLQMGESGRRRALEHYDWPVILDRYDALAKNLNEIRREHTGPDLARPPQRWARRADPFHRFSHYPTAVLQGHWRVTLCPDSQALLPRLLSLSMVNYGSKRDSPDVALAERLLWALGSNDEPTVKGALVAAGCSTPAGIRALMWLWKFHLVDVRPD